MAKKKSVEIKPGHECMDLRDGTRGVISAVQYPHNRFQFQDVSGWKYGLGHLVILPLGFAHSAIKSTESAQRSEGRKGEFDYE